jgi:pimeloyl-ACP methyl ester carboxylesterase
MTVQPTSAHSPAVPAGPPASQHPAAPRTGRGRIGWVVAGSLATGLVAALLLPFAPFIPAEERAVTGAVLCGFALGWAMLAVLSVRFTDQPQRWPAVPALFMGLGGLLLVAFGSSAHRVLDWVWPPALLALAIWTVVRVRRELHSRSGRRLLYPLLAFLALASVGGGYATVGAAADARAYPAPGQLVDVGGHRLHIHCTGSGSPTVILEPGQGGASSDSGWVAPTLARDSTVCVYDRAGRGWSDPADGPQDATRIAADLHTLLERAQVPGPYVLAGHSSGGLYVQTFAANYPDQVAGLVLLDSTAPKPGPALPTRTESYDVLGRVSAVFSAVAHLGAGRLIVQGSYGSLPPHFRGEARANASTAPYLASWIEEFVAANTSMQQAAALTNLDDKPLVVVTADTGNAAGWEQAQDKMATLSTNSSHRVAKDTTHATLLHDETDAAQASQAIHDVLRSVRTGSPLAQQ